MPKSIIITCSWLLWMWLGQSALTGQEQEVEVPVLKAQLYQVLEESEGWVKVHAAEYLLDLGYRDGLKAVFEQERLRSESSSPYRIGIWRVLAKEAATEEVRELWIGKIKAAYRDTAGSDRIHAAETLAKLGVNLMDVDANLVRSDLAQEDPVLRSYVLWGTVVGRDSPAPLIAMLGRGSNTEHRIVAYALSKLPSLQLKDWQAVYTKAIQGSPSSEAYADLVCAAYIHCPAERASEKERLHQFLTGILQRSDKYGQLRVLEALAGKGTPDHLPVIQALQERLEQNKAALSAADYLDLQATVAYALLKIDRRQKHPFTPLDWVAIALFGLLMIGVGGYYSRKNKNKEDYLLGGRNMHPFLVGLSFFATLLSTLSYLAYPGEMIQHGPVFFLGMAAFPIAYYVVGWHLIPKFMAFGVTSAYEILELKIGLEVRMLATFFFLSLRFLWMAMIIYATVDTAIVMIFGISDAMVPLICAVMAGITVLYTSLGGLKAVVTTDVIQFFVLLLGIILTLGIITIELGSVAAWIPDTFQPHWDQINWGIDAKQRLTFGNAFLMVLTWQICTAGSDQMAIQRYLATKDVKAARKTFGVSLISTFVIQSLLGLAGLALMAYFLQFPEKLADGQSIIHDADRLFPQFILTGLPAGITGIVTAGLMAAAMSSLSSGLNSSSSVILEDLVKRFSRNGIGNGELKLVRNITILLGIVVTVISMFLGHVQGNLLDVVIKVVNLFVAPLFVLFFMALFVPQAKLGATLAGGLTALIVAMAIAFWKVFGIEVLWILPFSFIGGALAGVILSFIGKERGRDT